MAKQDETSWRALRHGLAVRHWGTRTALQWHFGGKKRGRGGKPLFAWLEPNFNVEFGTERREQAERLGRQSNDLLAKKAPWTAQRRAALGAAALCAALIGLLAGLAAWLTLCGFVAGSLANTPWAVVQTPGALARAAGVENVGLEESEAKLRGDGYSVTEMAAVAKRAGKIDADRCFANGACRRVDVNNAEAFRAIALGRMPASLGPVRESLKARPWPMVWRLRAVGSAIGLLTGLWAFLALAGWSRGAMAGAAASQTALESHPAFASFSCGMLAAGALSLCAASWPAPGPASPWLAGCCDFAAVLGFAGSAMIIFFSFFAVLSMALFWLSKTYEMRRDAFVWAADLAIAGRALGERDELTATVAKARERLAAEQAATRLAAHGQSEGKEGQEEISAPIAANPPRRQTRRL
jgi:hypothetical protein